MNEKYKLTKETLKFDGHTLYRIKALKDFSDVKEGDLGGWIESERNLSRYNGCWIYDDAKLYDNACVCDDAKIYGNAEIKDNAYIHGKVSIYDDASISGFSEIWGNVSIYGKTSIRRNSRICCSGDIYGQSILSNIVIQEKDLSATINIHDVTIEDSKRGL